MQMKKRGLVGQIENGYCIIINKDGTFERIPMPSVEVRVGDEITYSNRLISSMIKPALLVASLLIVFMAYAFIHQAAEPKAIAYVSVDINPSLEIAVDKNLNVITVNCFNQDAVNLLKGENLDGKNIYSALNLISRKAVMQHYIKANQENLVVSTVTASDNNTHLIDNKKIQQSIENSVTSDNTTIQVRIYSVSAELRTTAKNMGLSPAKFIVYEQLKDNGKQVTISDVKESKIITICKKYKIELLPSNQMVEINSDKKLQSTEPLIEDDDKSAQINDPAANSSQRSSGDVSQQSLPNEMSNPASVPSSNDNNQATQPGLPVNNENSNPAAVASPSDNGQAIQPGSPVNNESSNPASVPNPNKNDQTIQPGLSVNNENNNNNPPAAPSHQSNNDQAIQPGSPVNNENSNSNPPAAPRK